MLSSNNLSYLPESFCNLNNLKDLKIRKNNLSSLPENFGDLGQLEILGLD